MPILGTYNGVSILAVPAKPGLRQIQIDMVDTVAMQRSPFTGQVQMQAFPGADFWSGTLTLPQMTASNAAQWSAFLASLRGSLNCFLLGHPLYRQPQGSVTGAYGNSPTISGVNAALQYSLNTRGWKPSTFGLLLPGDRIQIGATPNSATTAGLCRYHVVTERVDSDSNGQATLQVWPSLREATADGEALVLNNPQGLFRLADNTRSVLTTETRLSGLTLKIVEAR